MDRKTDLPAGWRHVLVITAPVSKHELLASLRDQVLESLPNGVVVLPEDCTYSVETLPVELCAQVLSSENGAAADEPCEDPPPGPAPEPEAIVEPTGRNADEKRAIQEALITYRKAHGLGCWSAVAQASRGKINEEQLRDMYSGSGNFTIATWRLAAKALDTLKEAAQ